VTGIYPLNENIFDEDRFLFSCVTDRPQSHVTEPANAPSSYKDNNEEGASVEFRKYFFPKAGP
jgi:hypothetical protein